MKRFLPYTMGLLLWVSLALAQEPSSLHQSSTSPPNARFQIVQSELAAKWTFRLDRFTGQVYQLVLTKSGDNAWESMPVHGLSSIALPTKARFQIFTSGIAARHTFLIDTDSGTTWTLVTNKEKQPDGTMEELYSWQPFSE